MLFERRRTQKRAGEGRARRKAACTQTVRKWRSMLALAMDKALVPAALHSS
jgi:hypothetical protein